MGATLPYCARVFTTMSGINSYYNVTMPRGRRCLLYHHLLFFRVVYIHDQPVAIMFVRRQQETLCPGLLFQIQDDPEETAMLPVPDIPYVTILQDRLRQFGEWFCVLQVDNDPVRSG